MIPVFDRDYFRKRMYLVWRAPLICGVIQTQLGPRSVVDVGCSVGEFVHCFLSLDINAIGIDSSPATREFFMGPQECLLIVDMSVPDQLFPKDLFDLTCCFEVGGILAEDQKLQFAKNLIQLSPKLLFAVGPEFQEDWIKILTQEGLKLYRDVSDDIRNGLSPLKHKQAIKAIYNGLLYFERE